MADASRCAVQSGAAQGREPLIVLEARVRARQRCVIGCDLGLRCLRRGHELINERLVLRNGGGRGAADGTGVELRLHGCDRVVESVEVVDDGVVGGALTIEPALTISQAYDHVSDDGSDNHEDDDDHSDDRAEVARRPRRRSPRGPRSLPIGWWRVRRRRRCRARVARDLRRCAVGSRAHGGAQNMADWVALS